MKISRLTAHWARVARARRNNNRREPYRAIDTTTRAAVAISDGFRPGAFGSGRTQMETSRERAQCRFQSAVDSQPNNLARAVPCQAYARSAANALSATSRQPKQRRVSITASESFEFLRSFVAA